MFLRQLIRQLRVRNRRQTVLGMNRRNHFIDWVNPPHAVYLVNDKLRTKQRLHAAGIAHIPTLAHICDRADLVRFSWQTLPDSWVLKPNQGSQGVGILLAQTRCGIGWRSASRRRLDLCTLKEHVHRILDGERSMTGVVRDSALFEPLVAPHPALAALAPAGLPDIRIICVRGEPVLAMARLPTMASAGRANLHQGAIGAGIDLDTGRITRARGQGSCVDRHPDTGAELVDVEIPDWRAILEIAVRCGNSFELGYMGVDIVVDRERGPLVMEVNARPGLEIQNVTGIGLWELLQQAYLLKKSGDRPQMNTDEHR